MPEQIIPKSELPGLYLHIPFCLSKCSYCDFHSVTDTSLIQDCLKALNQEMGCYVQAFSQYDTIYLGGGTPSLLTDDEISELVHQVHRQFNFTPEVEITLEANPDDVTPKKLRLWKELGVNRLSLGVQSLNDSELQFLGRRHDAAQARRAIDQAQEAGFANLGVDLIYALPGQSEPDWLATLDAVPAVGPSHLSCYQLTIAHLTPLGRKQARGEIRPVTAERQREFFLFTSEYLESRGYLHYEISNFARSEGHISRHNSKYWRKAPYLGLGPAAHSFDRSKRWWNVSSVPEYCRRLGQGRAPIAGNETLTETQQHLETLCLGLRTSNGVALADLAPFPQARLTLESLCETGLLYLERGRARPTREGFLVADSLALMLSE